MTTKSLAVHVTSILVGAAGFIALVHPGFVLPTIVVALVPIACALVVFGLQAVHDVAKHTLAFNLAALERAARAVASGNANATIVKDVKELVTLESAATKAISLSATETLTSDLATPSKGNFPAVDNKEP